MHSPTATLVHGDCRHDLARVTAPTAIYCFDPPYGINYKVQERSYVGRDNGLNATAYTKTEARAAIKGDAQPFDPAPWAQLPRVALFGANHFADQLPLGRWQVWDKRHNTAPDDHSDAELIWLSGDHKAALRIHRQLWRGVCRAGEENASRSKKLHPNQKPVALLTVLLQMLGAQPGDLVIDPYMGSGSTAVAALRMGCDFLGYEIDATHFETTRVRLIGEGIGLIHVEQTEAALA